MPSRIVRGADVTNLSGTHKRIQSFECLIEWRLSVPFMQLIQIDPIGLEPAQAVFALPNQVVPRHPSIIRSIAYYHSCFCREQNTVATFTESLSKDLL